MNTVLYGLLLICCITGSVVAYDESRPLGDLLETLPHTKLNVTQIEDDPSNAVSYVQGLVAVVGPGIALGALSVVIGIIYGIVKLCCCLCCSGSDDDDDDYKRKAYGFKKRIIPFVVYGLCFCWIFAGCIIGFTSNSKFSNGTNSLSNAVQDTGVQAVGLVDSLLDGLNAIFASIPEALNYMIAQISGLPEISSNVRTLGRNVNGTTQEISSITDQVASLDNFTRSLNGSISVLKDLNTSLSGINSQTSDVIGNVVSLTDQIADNLNGVLNGTLRQLNDTIDTINNSFNEVKSQSQEFVDKAKEMVNNMDDYIDQVKSYDSQRYKGLSAVYAVVMVTSAIGAIGWFIHKGFPFNITTAFSFIFSFLLWMSGSVHLLFGIILSDICPVADSVIHGFIPSGQAGDAINGCLGNTSLFTSLGLTDQFNLTSITGYTKDFDNFTSFMDNFSFGTIDNYLSNITTLYTYNLTAAANNVTVATFGWNQTIVYSALDALNNGTTPYNHYFVIANYTSFNGSDYPNNAEGDSIRNRYTILDVAYHTNQTIYSAVDQTKTRMNNIQNSINILMGNITSFRTQFNDTQNEIKDLSAVKVKNAMGALDGIVNNITNFFTLGDCSFVGTNYHRILDSVCVVMLPSIELLMASQYMIGLGFIPTIILCEVLAHRIKHAFYDEKVSPDKDDYDYDSGYQQPQEERGAISMGVRTSQE